jgi:Zn-dependent protease
VSFRLLGIPVDIHASFLVIAFLIGASGQGIDAALVWVVVVTVSVVAHELGHALVARPVGGDPRIDLFAMAGLTRWDAARASRARRVMVSLSGVAGGVALGLALVPLYHAVDPGRGTLLEYAFRAAFFANLGWGLLNLLPMLPLDGGQVVLAVMPGRDDVVRVVRTSWVSVVVGAAVAVAAARAGYVIAAAFVLFFGVGNVRTVLSVRRLTRHDARTRPLLERADTALGEGRAEEAYALARGADDPVARIVSAAALLRLGRPREAQERLLDLPRNVRIDRTFEAAVLLANGQEALARDILATSLPADPQTWAVRELAALLIARGDDVDALLAPVGPRGAVGAATALFHSGRYADAARWYERGLGAGLDDWHHAYNAACSYARAGDADRGLRMLDHAVLLGFRDGAVADTDDDLAALRAHPGWAAVRTRIG